MDQLDQLPTEHSRQVIKSIAEESGMADCTVTVTEGSKKGENFFGDVYKVRIEGGAVNGRPSAVKNLILKFSPDNLGFREVVPVDRYYKREIAAYTSILPALDTLQRELPADRKFRFANCRAVNEAVMEETVVMDDLSVEGFRLYDRLLSLDFDHVALAIKSLAAYHSLSFVMRRRNPNDFTDLARPVCKGMDYGVNFYKFVDHNKKCVLKLFEGTEYHERLSQYLSDMYGKMEYFLNPQHTEPYNVICHGDFWTSNLLFKYKEQDVVDVRIVDWQVVRLASPVIDIGYLLFTSTDEKFRNVYFHKTLDLYYETLKTNITMMGCDIDDCYPRDVFDRHVKDILPFGLLIAIVVCPVTISDRDSTPSLVEENEKFGESDECNFEFSKTPTERLTGGVKDFFKFGLYSEKKLS